MYGNSLNGIFAAFLVLAGVIGAALMGVVFWLAPMLWHAVKPWLHTITG